MSVRCRGCWNEKHKGAGKSGIRVFSFSTRIGGKGMKQVKILKNIPRYRNYANMRVFGPFQAGEELCIPKEEADFFISQGWAQPIRLLYRRRAGGLFEPHPTTHVPSGRRFSGAVSHTLPLLLPPSIRGKQHEE